MLKKLLFTALAVLPLTSIAEEYFSGPNITVINNTRLGCDENITPKCANYSDEFRKSGVALQMVYGQKYCYQTNPTTCVSGDSWASIDLQEEISLSHLNGFNWSFSASIAAKSPEANVWQEASCNHEAIKEKTSQLLNKQDAQPIFIRVDFGEDLYFPYVTVKCTVSDN